MIDPSLGWMAITTLTTVAATTAGWLLGGHRARARVERVAEESVRRVLAARDVAERRARELAAQNALWRSSTLAPRDLPAQPVYRDRMAPIEHEALVGMLQGLTLVDDAVIADTSGLARTRETDLDSAAIAALAAPVESLRRALGTLGTGLSEVRLETFDAVHAAIRPLGGRAAGAMLVARSTSLRVNPLALDAVAHVAAGGAGAPEAPRAASIWRGTSDRRRPATPGPLGFFDDLERELGRAGLRALVLGVKGKASFSASEDGPSESVRTATLTALDAFQARAARLLRGAGIARVEVVLEGGGVLHWAALAGEPSCVLMLVADDGTTSPALVERLSGRLRRSVDTSMLAAPSSANGVASPQLDGSLS